MSGVKVLRHLLTQAAAVTALVPAERIAAGVVPQGATLPAISLTKVSGVPHNPLAVSGVSVLHTDRVQVSALAEYYASMEAILVAVLAACPNQHGNVAGVQLDAIVPDSEGPDLHDPAIGLFERSRDFMVSYIA